MQLLKSNYKVILFWVFYLASILVYAFRPEQYERPLVFFVLMAIATVLLFLQILSANGSKKQIIFIFSEIVLLILTIMWSQMLIYAGAIGDDTWYHHKIIYKIINSITLNAWDYYGSTLFHYTIARFSVFTGISEVWSIMITMGIPYVAVISFVIYKIGSLVSNSKVGLLSTLILSMACFYITFGIELLPSSLAVVLILSAIYLLILNNNSHNLKSNIIRYIFITILFVSSLYCNAPISVFAVVVMILIWLGLLIYSRLIKKVEFFYHSFLIVGILFGAILLLWWTFSAYYQIFIIIKVLNIPLVTDIFSHLLPPSLFYEGMYVQNFGYVLVGNIMPDPNYLPNALRFDFNPRYADVMSIVTQFQSSVPLIEQIIKKASWVIYLGLGVISLIVLFFKKYRNQWVFALCFCVTMFGIIFLITFIFSRYLFISRFITVLQIILAPIIAMSLFVLMDYIKNKSSKIVFSILIFVLSLGTLLSPYVNVDNRQLTSNSVARLTFTTEELKGIDDICTKWEGVVYTDWFVNYYIYHNKIIEPQWNLTDCIDMSDYLVYGDYDKLPPNSLVLVRNEINDYATMVGNMYYKINYNVDDKLLSQGFTEIYNNGTVRAYAR